MVTQALFIRLIRHLFFPRFRVFKYFSEEILTKIEHAISESEKFHLAEIQFVVEGGLNLSQLVRGASSRDRAIQIFSDLKVWDTEHNSGVLVYVQLADRTLEIVADRGINQRVAADFWSTISEQVAAQFALANYLDGALFAIKEISALLIKNFPKDGESSDQNELSDRPTVL